ncbi:MAG: TrmH family RNA methyltransferase [Candidatus Saccharimonadales bacterium]
MHLIVIAHNIRSTHNVGAIFRTCDAFGVEKLVLTGYTPYPSAVEDDRLPYIQQKVTAKIHKTALGAENTVHFEHVSQVDFTMLRHDGYHIVGLEQSPRSIPLQTYNAPAKIALILGEERYGISYELMSQCDDLVEIPMYGKKESLNVSVATGITLFYLQVIVPCTL